MNKYVSAIVISLFLFLSASCATSNNNYKDDPFNASGGGGGYDVHKKSDGVYEIMAITNGAIENI